MPGNTNIVIDMKAKITGYQEEIAKIQAALNKIKLDTKIGKELKHEFDIVQKQVENLSKNLHPRVFTGSGIDKLTDKLSSAAERLHSIGETLQEVNLSDLDSSKFSAEIIKAQKEVDELRNSLIESFSTGLQKKLQSAVDHSSSLGRALKELKVDLNDINEEGVRQALAEGFSAAEEKIKSTDEEIKKLTESVKKYEQEIEELKGSSLNKNNINIGDVVKQLKKGDLTSKTALDPEKALTQLEKWYTLTENSERLSSDAKLKIKDFLNSFDFFTSVEKANQVLGDFLNNAQAIGAKKGDLQSIFGGGTNFFGQSAIVDPEIVEQVKGNILYIIKQFGEEFKRSSLERIKYLIDKDAIDQAREATMHALDEAYIRINSDLEEKLEKLSKMNASITTVQNEQNAAIALKSDITKGQSSLDDIVNKLQIENEDLRNRIQKLEKDLYQGKTGQLSGIHNIGQGISNKTGEELRKNKDEARGYSEQLKQVTEREKLLGRIEGLAQRWFSVYAAVNLVRRAFNAVKTTLKELDDIMTKIAIVTKMSQGDLWEQMPKYTQLAQQYASSIKGVYEVSQLYYQQGLQANDVMALTEETLKMARISGLDYAEATNYMTNAIRSFKMEMTEAQRVVDVYSALAAKSATDTAELATAMSKTASSAEAVGSSFENTTAMMAVMIESTRESATNIGSAMKSIISRYGEMTSDPSKLIDSEGEALSLNKVDKALQTVGIAIHDAEGQFRDFDEVILELAKKWDTIDKNTQRYISTIMAGNRQQSRFLALVSNGERLVELFQEAADAQDTATLQVLKTMDSISAKSQQLKTNLQSMFVSTGLEQLYKNILDFSNEFIDTFTRMPTFLNLPIPALLNFGQIFITLGTTFRDVIKLAKGEVIHAVQETNQVVNSSLGDIQNQAINTGNIFEQTFNKISNSSKLQVGLRMAGSAISLYAAGLGEATGKARLFKAALQGAGGALQTFSYAASGNIPMAIFSGITTAISVLSTTIETAEERAQRLRESAEKANNEYLEKRNNYKELEKEIEKYKELKKAQNDNEEAKKSYIEAGNALAEKIPQLVKYYDDEGNAVLDLTNQYILLNNARSEAAKSAQKAAEASLIEEENKRKELINNSEKNRALIIQEAANKIRPSNDGTRLTYREIGENLLEETAGQHTWGISNEEDELMRFFNNIVYGDLSNIIRDYDLNPEYYNKMFSKLIDSTDETISDVASYVTEILNLTGEVDGQINSQTYKVKTLNESLLARDIDLTTAGKKLEAQDKNTSNIFDNFSFINDIITNYIISSFENGDYEDYKDYKNKGFESDYNTIYEALFLNLKQLDDSSVEELNKLFFQRERYTKSQFQEKLKEFYNNINIKLDEELEKGLLQYYDNVFTAGDFIKEINMLKDNNRKHIDIGDYYKRDDSTTLLWKLSENELRSVSEVFYNLNDLIDNNTISKSLGQDILNGYLSMWDIAVSKSDEAAQSLLEGWTDFSLSGIQQLIDTIEDNETISEETKKELKESLEKLKLIVPVNLNTEVQTLLDTATEGMEEFEKAVSNAVKGMDFKTAVEMAEKLGKTLTDSNFDFEEGKYYYNNLEDIEQSYLEDAKKQLDNLDGRLQENLKGISALEEFLTVEYINNSNNQSAFEKYGLNQIEVQKKYNEYNTLKKEVEKAGGELEESFAEYLSRVLTEEVGEAKDEVFNYAKDQTIRAGFSAGLYEQTFKYAGITDEIQKAFYSGNVDLIRNSGSQYTELLVSTVEALQKEGLNVIEDAIGSTEQVFFEVDRENREYFKNFFDSNTLKGNVKEVTDEQGHIIGYYISEITSDIYNQFLEELNLTNKEIIERSNKGRATQYDLSLENILVEILNSKEKIKGELVDQFQLITGFNDIAIETIFGKRRTDNTYDKLTDIAYTNFKKAYSGQYNIVDKALLEYATNRSKELIDYIDTISSLQNNTSVSEDFYNIFKDSEAFSWEENNGEYIIKEVKDAGLAMEELWNYTSSYFTLTAEAAQKLSEAQAKELNKRHEALDRIIELFSNLDPDNFEAQVLDQDMREVLTDDDIQRLKELGVIFSENNNIITGLKENFDLKKIMLYLYTTFLNGTIENISLLAEATEKEYNKSPQKLIKNVIEDLDNISIEAALALATRMGISEDSDIFNQLFKNNGDHYSASESLLPYIKAWATENEIVIDEYLEDSLIEANQFFIDKLRESSEQINHGVGARINDTTKRLLEQGNIGYTFEKSGSQWIIKSVGDIERAHELIYEAMIIQDGITEEDLKEQRQTIIETHDELREKGKNTIDSLNDINSLGSWVDFSNGLELLSEKVIDALATNLSQAGAELDKELGIIKTFDSTNLIKTQTSLLESFSEALKEELKQENPNQKNINILKQRIIDTQNAIYEIINNYIDLITNGIKGTMSIEQATQLKNFAESYGLDIDYHKTAEGLKLSQKSANELYLTMKQVDYLQSEILFKELSDNLKESRYAYQDIVAIQGRIADLQKEINSLPVGSARRKEYEKELEVAKEIKETRALTDEDAFNFIDRELPTPIKSQLGMWDSIGNAFKEMNDAVDPKEGKGFMDPQKFYNMVNGFNSMAASMGSSIMFMGMELNGSAEAATKLIEKGFSALANVDGDGAKINLEKLGWDIASGASGMQSGVQAGVKNMAKANIEMLDAMIAFLEVIVAFESFDELDTNDTFGIQFDELLEETGLTDINGDKLYTSTKNAKKIAGEILELAKTNEDLNKGLDSVKINGISARQALEKINSNAKMTAKEWDKYVKVTDVMYRAAASGDFSTQNLTQLIVEAFGGTEEELLVEVNGRTFAIKGNTVMEYHNGKYIFDGRAYKSIDDAEEAQRLKEEGIIIDSYSSKNRKIKGHINLDTNTTINTTTNLDTGETTFSYNNKNYDNKTDALKAVLDHKMTGYNGTAEEYIVENDLITKWKLTPGEFVDLTGTPLGDLDDKSLEALGLDTKLIYAIEAGVEKALSNINLGEIIAKSLFAGPVITVPLGTKTIRFDGEIAIPTDQNGNYVVDGKTYTDPKEAAAAYRFKINHNLEDVFVEDGVVSGSIYVDANTTVSISQDLNVPEEGIKYSVNGTNYNTRLEALKAIYTSQTGDNPNEGDGFNNWVISSGISAKLNMSIQEVELVTDTNLAEWTDKQLQQHGIDVALVNGIKAGIQRALQDPNFNLGELIIDNLIGHGATERMATANESQDYNPKLVFFGKQLGYGIYQGIILAITEKNGADTIPVSIAEGAIDSNNAVQNAGQDLATALSDPLKALSGNGDESLKIAGMDAAQKFIDGFILTNSNDNTSAFAEVLIESIKTVMQSTFQADGTWDWMRTIGIDAAQAFINGFTRVDDGESLFTKAFKDPVQNAFKQLFNSLDIEDIIKAFNTNANIVIGFDSIDVSGLTKTVNIFVNTAKTFSDIITKMQGNVKDTNEYFSILSEELDNLKIQSVTSESAVRQTANQMHRLPDKSQEVGNTANAIEKLQSKDITISGTVSLEATVKSNGAVTVNAHAGPIKTDFRSFAKGTLMGELGPELYVTNGHYYVAGQNGAEMVDLPNDAIVFNHMQTKKLIGNGKVNSRGVPVKSEKDAISFATGNVTGPAMARAKEVLAILKALRSMWQSMLNASFKDLGGFASSYKSKSKKGSDVKYDRVKNVRTTSDIERWYNIERQIYKLEQDIAYQESLINKYQNDRVANGKDIYALYKKQIDATSAELALVQEKNQIQQDFYNQQVKEIENSALGKIFSFTEDGVLQIKDMEFLQQLNEETVYGKGINSSRDVEAQLTLVANKGFDLNEFNYSDDDVDRSYYVEGVNKFRKTREQYNAEVAKYNKEKAEREASGDTYTTELTVPSEYLEGKELKEAQEDLMNNIWTQIQEKIDNLDTAFDELNENREREVELTAQLNERLQVIVDNQISVENAVMDALVDMREAEIDEIQKMRDAYQESVEKMVTGLEDALDKERQVYEDEENRAELTKLQRQLAILQRSGGSPSQIKSLQDQINAQQKDLYFSEREKEIQAIQDAADKQIERLDTQINLMTETLEYEKAHGLLWNQVYTIMSQSESEILSFILTNGEQWNSSSSLGTQENSRQILEQIQIWKKSSYDSEESLKNKIQTAVDNSDVKVINNINSLSAVIKGWEESGTGNINDLRTKISNWFANSNANVTSKTGELATQIKDWATTDGENVAGLEGKIKTWAEGNNLTITGKVGDLAKDISEYVKSTDGNFEGLKEYLDELLGVKTVSSDLIESVIADTQVWKEEKKVEEGYEDLVKKVEKAQEPIKERESSFLELEEWDGKSWTGDEAPWSDDPVLMIDDEFYVGEAPIFDLSDIDNISSNNSNKSSNNSTSSQKKTTSTSTTTQKKTSSISSKPKLGVTVTDSNVGALPSYTEVAKAVSLYPGVTDFVYFSDVASKKRKIIPKQNAPYLKTKGTTVVAKFAKGGLIDYTGPAWVDGSRTKPEGILNAEQMEILRTSLLGNKIILPNMIKSFDNLQKLIENNNTMNTNNTGMNIENINLNMNIASIANDYDARRAGQQALEEFVRVARKNGVNSLSRR